MRRDTNNGAEGVHDTDVRAPVVPRDRRRHRLVAARFTDRSMHLTHKLLHLLPAGLLALAACESGSGDTTDASTEDATTADETGAPTTGADTDATGDSGETGVAATTEDTSESAEGDATTDLTGGTTADDTTTGDATTDDGTTGAPIEAPEIAGMYTDEYGSMHTVDVLAWTIDTSVFHVLAVDNAGDHLVARNDAANDFFPDLYSRFDWYLEGEELYFCQISYDAPSEADAEMTAPADVADLMMGCGGFPWTLLTP